MKIKLGDSVIVKQGLKDVDFGGSIAGWQGRVIEVTAEGYISVQWDSITLKQMPFSTIEKSEQKGMGWNEYYLTPSDVELTEARDSREEVAEAFGELQKQSEWLHLGEQGKRIHAVLSNADSLDAYANEEDQALDTWASFLKANLSFPFAATIEDAPFFTPPAFDAGIEVKGISDLADRYGLIAEIRSKEGNHAFSLSFLEARDKSSKNWQVLMDYVVWFANC
jgi:ribosomal protein L24